MSISVYVRSKVIKGFGRGSRELGCPTANVADIENLNIPTGIYCGLAQVIIESKDQIQEQPGERESYQRVIDRLPFNSGVVGWVGSHGFNPHYGNKEKSLEVYLMDSYGFDFYGAEIRVLICKRMRDEEKYNSLEDLKEAIANDIKMAKEEIVKFQHLSSNEDYFLNSKTTLAASL